MNQYYKVGLQVYNVLESMRFSLKFLRVRISIVTCDRRILLYLLPILNI
jgi:hypothetical protein